MTEKYENYTPWFAWHPVRVAGRWVWLRFVLRRGGWKWGGGCYEWVWEYREVGNG